MYRNIVQGVMCRGSVNRGSVLWGNVYGAVCEVVLMDTV